jgi:mRNA interferase YafQ
MYSIFYTGQFKKSLKLAAKRGLDITLLTAVIDELQEKGMVDNKYDPHPLKGNYKGCMECHIQFYSVGKMVLRNKLYC